MKFALNAGHGYNTAGKRCMKSIDPNETREYVLNKRICDKVQSICKDYTGIDILRIDDGTEMSLNTRAKLANNWKADYYIAVHHNAGIYGKSGGGIEVYTYLIATAKAKSLQEAVYKKLIAYTGLKGNRSQPLRKANFAECRLTKMPAILIENGFMDSTHDTPIILTEDFANKSAQAIADVMIQLSGAKKKVTPVVTPKPETQTTTESSKKSSSTIKTIQKWLNTHYKTNISEDGFYGPKTKAALIKALQTYLNVNKKAGLVVDGQLGPKTKTALSKINIKRGSKNNAVYILQGILYCLGYDPKGFDGRFGPGCDSAVEAFQKDRELEADRIVGRDTWSELLK